MLFIVNKARLENTAMFVDSLNLFDDVACKCVYTITLTLLSTAHAERSRPTLKSGERLFRTRPFCCSDREINDKSIEKSMTNTIIIIRYYNTFNNDYTHATKKRLQRFKTLKKTRSINYVKHTKA